MWHGVSLLHILQRLSFLCCALRLFIFFVPGPGTQEDVAVVSLSTPYGGMLQTVLPDSSRVWLNANSTLEYPAVFDMDERKVSDILKSGLIKLILS